MMNENTSLSFRISSFLHSVRLRLTLWFLLILGLVLIVFSAFVYTVEAQAIRSQANARLNVRMHDFQDMFRRTMHFRDDGGPADIQNFSPASQFALYEQEVLVLTDPTGKLLGDWGSISSQAAASLAQITPSHSGPRLFSYKMTSSQNKDSQAADYLMSTAPLGVGDQIFGWVLIGEPVDPEGQLARLFITLALSILGALLIALIGGYWLADRALWPVKAITRTAREISESDLSRRLNIKTRDELGELASTFDRMLDRLQAAFSRQRQFTADASHELRTPLTIIGLETDRALSTRRSTDEYQRALQVIHSENQFMSQLVNELLTLARMDAGQVHLNCERLDLSDLALEIMERYAQIAAKKGIQLKTGSLPELPIQGDRQYLTQMIGNLVDNAIKYTPAGPEKWVQVETGSREEHDHSYAWVSVTDNGIGIDTEHVPHLFDRFYRADRARSHNAEEDDGEEIPGSGLGLAIVQWIAQMHNGKVNVRSGPGQGTTFEIEIPNEPDQAHPN